METVRPKKEDRRVRYTKQAIRDGFLRLLAEKPIEKISVTEICREADINRGTFYAHYSDPYELKHSLEDQLSEAMEQRLRESGLKRLNSLQTLQLLQENKELCRVLQVPTAIMTRCSRSSHGMPTIILSRKYSSRVR